MSESMDLEDLRFECLKLVNNPSLTADQIVAYAAKFADFILNGVAKEEEWNFDGSTHHD